MAENGQKWLEMIKIGQINFFFENIEPATT